MGHLDPHLAHDSLGLPSLNPNGISIGSAVFAQMTVAYPYTLQWGALPLKIAIPIWEIRTPSIVPWAHPSPQSIRYLNQFSRFCKAHSLYNVTDRPRYSVCKK